MNTTTCTHKDNPNFWIFGLFFFLYFFIMATCFPFLPIWLSDIIGLNKTHTGIVFSCISLSAIAFQPVLGVISDKLGLRKTFALDHFGAAVPVRAVLPVRLRPAAENQYLAGSAERWVVYRLCLLSGFGGD
ncbi:MFS transporter [Enterobacter hormaechei subsp. xiangfangensis]|uniref:MFS transporter n=1 Tax=Enterobacter hormaechei TaxID=158836 RepID=UPI003F4411A2